MPLQSTSGAASYDAFGGGAAAKVNYIEDFFQSYLRTGTGASATVTTGLDGSTKETLVWTKSRSAATNHKLTDNVRGATKALSSNTTGAEATDSQGLTAFSATGYTIGTNTDYNNSGATYVDWQWVAQPKFFDVLTYTGNGTAGRTVAHNLGSTPACIIVKASSVDTGDFWGVYHRSLGATKAIFLSATNAAATSSIYWNNTAPTSTNFTVGDWSGVNQNGTSYVAYLFAHDAGGFGLTGTDNVISCGSFNTGAGDDVTVSLGYEPQWVMVKATNAAYSWEIYDNMRGMGNTFLSNLNPNLTQADNYQSTSTGLVPNATGFRSSAYWGANTNLIYIAIRRGPMKVPTDATKVFGLSARSGTGANATVTGGQTDDAVLVKNRGSAVASLFSSRLTGTGYLVTSSTAAEVAAGTTILQTFPWDVMDGVKVGTTSTITNASANTYINYLFKRAPSFMDVVCYTGTGANATFAHNLTVEPEMMIFKHRNGVSSPTVYTKPTGATTVGELNTSNQFFGSNFTPFNSTAPTSTVFSVGTAPSTNAGTGLMINYLFATCAGVSKVGSYTGNGTTQTIDCGFTAGARFVLIKRTDSTGDWYVWDSARGIVSGNDPYLLLNSTAAEVTSTDYIDTYSAGFEISSTAPAAINASGGTFIFLAIA